jgi:hypothetical protein
MSKNKELRLVAFNPHIPGPSKLRMTVIECPKCGQLLWVINQKPYVEAGTPHECRRGRRSK